MDEFLQAERAWLDEFEAKLRGLPQAVLGVSTEPVRTPLSQFLTVMNRRHATLVALQQGLVEEETGLFRLAPDPQVNPCGEGFIYLIVPEYDNQGVYRLVEKCVDLCGDVWDLAQVRGFGIRAPADCPDPSWAGIEFLLSLVCEPCDLALTVRQLSEGDLTALLGLLPYVPHQTGDILLRFLRQFVPTSQLDKFDEIVAVFRSRGDISEVLRFADDEPLEVGRWVSVNEHMSASARAYQSQITGMPPGLSYEVNGVKFDGFRDGVLLDAKDQYRRFVDSQTGDWESWWRGREELIKRARSQVAAANGIPIQWHWADEEAALAARQTLEDENIIEIEIIYTPPLHR
jgi:hypothetical protein